MDKTKIEWCDATWNPVRAQEPGLPTGWGCHRISPGCQNCYAERVNQRLGTRLNYDALGIAAATHYLDSNALAQPLRWRKPRRIFLSSMTDVFGEWVSDDMFDRLFAVMALTPQHTFMVLTKRAERMRRYIDDDHSTADRVRVTSAEFVEPKEGTIIDWPLPNVWLGVSVEDQQRANERIPLLLQTPAAVRFLSCEPLLGPIELSRGWLEETGVDWPWGPRDHIDHIIVGGESGPGARPCDLAWIRSIIAQTRSRRVEMCRRVGYTRQVPVFVKQFGSRPIGLPGPTAWRGTEQPAGRLRDRKGGDPDEWPEDLRVREWPERRRGMS